MKQKLRYNALYLGNMLIFAVVPMVACAQSAVSQIPHVIRIVPAHGKTLFPGTTLKGSTLQGSLTGEAARITVPAADFTSIPRRPPIPFVPFAMIDPSTGRAVLPGSNIRLANGKIVNAGSYYAALNQYEKILNASGYTLRKQGSYRTAYRVNYPLLAQQARMLDQQALRHPWIIPIQPALLARQITMARTLLLHPPVPHIVPPARHMHPAGIVKGVTVLPAVVLGSINSASPDQTPGMAVMQQVSPVVYAALHASAVTQGPSKGGKVQVLDAPLPGFYYPYNLDMGDPGTIGAYLHSYLDANGDKNSVTLEASADAGGYLLGNKIDVAGLQFHLDSSLGKKAKGTASFSLLGNTVKTYELALNNPQVNLDLIPPDDQNIQQDFFNATIMAGPVPVTIDVYGGIGLDAPLQVLTDIAQVNTAFTPAVSLNAGASVEIGVPGVLDAGVKCTVNVLTLSCPLNGAAALLPGSAGNGGTNAQDLGIYVNLTGDLDYTLLSGKFDVFADVTPLAHFETTIFHWPGYKNHISLFSVNHWYDLNTSVPPVLIDASAPGSIPSLNAPPQPAAVALNAIYLSTNAWTGKSNVENFITEGETVPSSRVYLTALVYDQFGNQMNASVPLTFTVNNQTIYPGSSGITIEPPQGGGEEQAAVSVNGTKIVRRLHFSFAASGAAFAPFQLVPDHGACFRTNTVTLTGPGNPLTSPIYFGSSQASILTPASVIASEAVNTAHNIEVQAPASAQPGFVPIGNMVTINGPETSTAMQPFSSLPQNYYYYVPNVPCLLLSQPGGLPNDYPLAETYPGYDTSFVTIPVALWDAAGTPETGESIVFQTDKGQFSNGSKQSVLQVDSEGRASETLSLQKNSAQTLGQVQGQAYTDIIPAHVTIRKQGGALVHLNVYFQYEPSAVSASSAGGAGNGAPSGLGTPAGGHGNGLPGHPAGGYQHGVRASAYLLRLPAAQTEKRQKAPFVLEVPVMLTHKNGQPAAGALVQALAAGAAVSAPHATDSHGKTMLFVFPQKGASVIRITLRSSSLPGVVRMISIQLQK